MTVRERHDKTTFRFWQEGSGYDRNIDNPKTLEAAINYVHDNPIRRGLANTADEWKWSSWHAYFGDVKGDQEEVPTVHGLPDRM